MTRFTFFLLTLCFLFVNLSAKQSDKEKPKNVLMILVDDLKPTFGAYGTEWVHSPNMDKLAAKGMRFDRAYCNTAVCGPSRNNLLIGLRSTTTGLYTLSQNFRKKMPESITLMQYFMQHGYRTEGVGKIFHIGHGNVGDDFSWSLPFHPDKVIDYVLEESTNGQLTREEAYFSNQVLGNINSLPRGAAWEKADVDDDAYADGRIALEGIRRLREAKKSDQPFFLALGFVKPHLPFCAPAKYWDLYDRSQFKLTERDIPPTGAPRYAGKPKASEIGNFKPVPSDGEIPDDMARTLNHGYYAALSYMDAQLGRVIDELERLGMAENTVIMLWGDHGYHFGDHGTWTKHTNYEQDNRIPLVFVSPDLIEPGSSTDAFVETVDIFPTLAKLAGLPLPVVPQGLDGESLIPILMNEKNSIRNHAYHCFRRDKRLGRAIRTDRYRMVEWREFGAPLNTAIYELYDYKEDKLESNNIADSNPKVLNQLKAILASHPEAVFNE